MAKKFKDWSVDQSFLFPSSVQDFVPEEHMSHFIRDLVREELDLTGIMSDYEEERGHPGYDPRMMVGILLYAYSRGIYSSRKISTSCIERVDFMAVSAMCKPGFRAIARFRRRHFSELGDLFVQVLQLCDKAGLVKLGHVALDGSKVKGNASKRKGMSYKNLKSNEAALEKQINEWLEKANKIDEEEDEEFGEDQRGDELPSWVTDKEARRQKFKEAREALESKDKEEREARKEAESRGEKPRSHDKKRKEPQESRRYNFTDPDSAMLYKGDHFIQGYNSQVAIDVESQVIVSTEVINKGADNDALKPAIEQIKKNLRRSPKELSADNGYLSEENLKILNEEGISGYIALGKDQPGVSARSVPPDSLTDKMGKKLRKAGKRSRYKLRRRVETVFGVIKSARSFSGFLTRGLDNVNNEWLLVCTAHNLHKLKAARS